MTRRFANLHSYEFYLPSGRAQTDTELRLSRMIEGFTVIKTKGYWMGKPETTYVIQARKARLRSGKPFTSKDARDVMRAYGRIGKQDAVYYRQDEKDVLMFRGKDY